MQLSEKLDQSLGETRLEVVAFATFKKLKSSFRQEHDRIEGILELELTMTQV